MRIVTFQRRAAASRAGVLIGDSQVLDLGRGFGRSAEKSPPKSDDTGALVHALRGLSGSVLEILRGGDMTLTHCFQLERAAMNGELTDCILPLSDCPLIAPVPNPPAIVHFESNEKFSKVLFKFLGGDDKLPREWYEYPQYYFGHPTLASGPDFQVRFPRGEDAMDFELELGAILSEDVRDASPEDAEDAILGYTIVNDWTARGLQRSLPGAAKGKSIATTFGPFIVSKDKLRDPYNLKTAARVNGVEMGTGTTKGLHYTFGQMISYASENMTLPAGTLICSGTLPGGSGLEKGRFLNYGDTVELEIEGLGVLRNRVYDRPFMPVYVPQ